MYNSGYTQYRIDLSPGEIIFNPIDIDSVVGGHKEPGKILFVGNVTQRKGIKELSEAVSELDVTLHIVGDGYLQSKIEGNNIVKHGKLDYDETKKHLASSEILVVPSIWPEPFGRVAVEGMAAEIPVIVSPYGGLPEVVGEAGMILTEISVPEIRQYILRLHKDATLRKILTEKGRDRSKLFHPKTIAENMTEIYENLLRSK
jgi:glycosyltransferase involved in cell wall biosynthesis